MRGHRAQASSVMCCRHFHVVDEAERLLSHDAIRNGRTGPVKLSAGPTSTTGEVFLLHEVLGRQHNQHQQISQG